MGVRLGVVGVGWWASFNHIPVAKADPRADVVAISDLSDEHLQKVGDAFGISGRYLQISDMLASEQLDGVMIATPHVAHAEAALPCLEAGLHVLIEKPMTTTVADAHAIQRAAANAKRQVLVPCGWNFRNYTAVAAAMVEAGKLGKIEHVSCQMASALDDLFAGQAMLETADHLFRPPSSTWADPARAGGYGWGQMSHSLAWVFRVTGLSPHSAYCMDGKSPTGVDYYDAACLRFTNGATMALSGSSTVPKHCGFQMDIRIFGSEGMLLFDVERERLELRRRDGADEVVPIVQGEGAYDGTLPVTRFIGICAGESCANEANADVGVRVVEALEALYRSAESGTLAEVAPSSGGAT
jgi:predicted dehydrogenase